VDYELHRQKPSGKKPRVKPPRRIENLRKGGGRRDRPGWTEAKRKSNRERFHKLRPLIKTGVTIHYPRHATREQLIALDECNQNFCKEHNLPARSIWEGPGKHQHLGLGIQHDPVLVERWKARLNKRSVEFFGEPMPAKAFLWKPEIKPDEIASYFSKTWKDGKKVKGAWPWLTWNPVWETGFRRLLETILFLNTNESIPRKKSVSDSPENEGHADSPHYTAETSEKEGDGPVAEELTLADLWESSPLRLETQTVGELLQGLPEHFWRLPLSLTNESSAVAEAMSLHSARKLLLAFRSGETLVCLSSCNGLFGESLERKQLLHHGASAVYYASCA